MGSVCRLTCTMDMKTSGCGLVCVSVELCAADWGCGSTESCRQPHTLTGGGTQVCSILKKPGFCLHLSSVFMNKHKQLYAKDSAALWRQRLMEIWLFYWSYILETSWFLKRKGPTPVSRTCDDIDHRIGIIKWDCLVSSEHLCKWDCAAVHQ